MSIDQTAFQPETAKRAAPLSLWRAMRDFLCLLHNLFGGPADIAERRLIERKRHMLMLPWLRAGEAFLRRLVYIEALALLADAPPLAPLRAARPRRRRWIEVYPDKPEGWPVHFRMFEAKRSARRGARRRGARQPPIWIPAAFRPQRPRPGQSGKSGDTHSFSLLTKLSERSGMSVCHPTMRARFRNAWPAAERLEAMLRVYNDPHASARRLAVALRRRAGGTARLITPQPQTIANLVGAQTFARCDAIVARRQRQFQRACAPPDSS